MNQNEMCKGRSFCNGLKSALADTEGESPKGLAVATGFVGEEPRPRTVGVVYREKRGANGMLLNYCPWCGTDIRFWMTQAQRDADTIVQETLRRIM